MTAIINTDLDQYNESYGIDGVLSFVRGQGDMPVAEIKNDLAQASIALQGAHVLGFQANDQPALIWMSPEASFAEGKSLRGGIPVCWPWFGPHPSDSSLPAHGPARTTNWQPIASKANADGSTRISFEMLQSPAVIAMCGHALRVRLHVNVGASLTLELETTNQGQQSFTLGQALHTYFQVGDVRQARIEGLADCTYIDKVDGGIRKKQHGAVEINAETDRIYLATGDDCEIIDPALGRKILISSNGSASTVVWNPWVETALKMGDLGPDGYLHMLCVENTNAADDVVELAAGATHRLVTNYSNSDYS